MANKKKLYYRDSEGNFLPYTEEVVDNALYVKVGGKYKPLGMLCDKSDIREGIWVVRKGTNWTSYTNGDYLRHVYGLEKVGPIQKVSMSEIGGLEELSDYLCEHMDEVYKAMYAEGGTTASDLARKIVGLLYKFEKTDN